MNGVLIYLVKRSVGETLSPAPMDKAADRIGVDGGTAADRPSASVAGTVRPRPRNRYESRPADDLAATDAAMPRENLVDRSDDNAERNATAISPDEERRGAPPPLRLTERRHDVAPAPSQPAGHLSPQASPIAQRPTRRELPYPEGAVPTTLAVARAPDRAPATVKPDGAIASQGDNVRSPGHAAVIEPGSIRPRADPAPPDRRADPPPPIPRTPAPLTRGPAAEPQSREQAVSRSAERAVRPSVSARQEARHPVAAPAPLHSPFRIPPPVQLSIGRVEVHATVAPSPPPPPPRASSKPAMSLDDYLKGRDGGATNSSARDRSTA